MRKAATAAGVLLLIAASQVCAWTMVYDGFAYEPPTNRADGWWFLSTPTEYNYHIGDPRYWDNTVNPIPAQYVYPPSAWVGARNTAQGYWPFIGNNTLSYPGLPASTGHCVVVFGSASNGAIVSRISPINLGQTPPTGPYRAIVRGTVYYSLVMQVIDAPAHAQGGSGQGWFHAGFNNQPPDPTCISGTSCTVSRAGARLRLRNGSTTENFKFNVGIESDTGDASTIVWDQNMYDAGSNTTPRLVVVSYEFKPGTGDDVSRMWIDPPQASLGGATEPAPYTNGATTYPLVSTGGDINQDQIRSFFLREGHTTNNPTGAVTRVVFDELRIGTNWADVTSNVPCTPPTVTDISPGSAAPGQQLSGVSITGSGFVQGVTLVRLRATGEPDIVATAVDVLDSGHLTGNFNIPANTAPGARDVVVITCPESPATLAGAFEIGACAPAADFDCDGDVDGADFAAFRDCASGAAVPFETGCDEKDLDGDVDVDMDDFGVFQRCYTGVGVPANPNCAS